MLLGLDFLYVYIDDILVASSSTAEHQTHLHLLFKRLSEFGVLINSSKCVWGQNSVKFLGYQILQHGIQPSADKIEAIKKFPLPKTAQELRRFLGTVNFYRRTIPRAAARQALLNELLKGNVKGKEPIHWDETTLTTFEECKKSLAETTLLVFPTPNAPLAIFTDASDVAIGAVLQQKFQGGWQPLGFFSEKLSTAEEKYGAYYRELLANYKSIKHFRHMRFPFHMGSKVPYHCLPSSCKWTCGAYAQPAKIRNHVSCD